MKWSYMRATITGGFFRTYQGLVRTEVIPYQWNVLNDRIPGAATSHAMENLRIAGGLSNGRFEGRVFQDSDVYKWLEAVGYLLAEPASDAELRSWADEAIDTIAAAQQPDGYLNSYFTMKGSVQRWKNLRQAHELYCAGHFIEAAVAVYRATKNQKVLDIATKLADHIDSRFGVEPGKVRGYPGHEEVELALIKLYRLTGEKRYLSLAEYFVYERGRSPSYFELEAGSSKFQVVAEVYPPRPIRSLEYFQAHKPVLEQADAVGHAVRAMYLAIAMADLAFETENESLAAACVRIWESATSRRMYLTGGIGSEAHDEAFTTDYDLPNDTAYNETCAAIGLFLFSHSMAALQNEGRYADVMERALYNGILSGLSLDGRNYFYVNPLEVTPKVCESNSTYGHVKYQRHPWHSCACCPPNVARLLASLGEYLYHVGGATLYADLYHTGALGTSIGGKSVVVRQETGYPWSESISFEFLMDQPAEFNFAVRIPEWCKEWILVAAGEKVDPASVLRDGYARVHRTWRKGDRVELKLSMPPTRVNANPLIAADWGKVAVQRGPIVYCLEECDNGGNLHTVVLPRASAFRESFQPELLGGVVTIAAEGSRCDGVNVGDTLYESSPQPDDASRGTSAPAELVFVPYFSWANRTPGEMRVWLRE